MNITLLTHESKAGNEIAKSLKSGKYSNFKVAVAYAKNSGISRIYNDLADFSNKGGKTSVIVGIDQNITSYQALVNLKTFAKENLFIHHDINYDITFHPKIYLFGNEKIEKVIIGSSNLTAGGFYLNYEANIGVILDTSKESKNFQTQVSNYWNELLCDGNTKKCNLSFLNKLLEYGSVVDECKQKPFKKIIERISNLPFKIKKKAKTIPPIATESTVKVPPLKERFAMILSAFDVSKKSQDPVILIPVTALKLMSSFWNFPMHYTNSGAGYPELYTIANIIIDGEVISDQLIRIYYYDQKKEFRLQCEPIKRKGKKGDIVEIHKEPNKLLKFEIELLRQGSPKYKKIRQILSNKVSNQKFFNYY